jgi:hypothetical protein
MRISLITIAVIGTCIVASGQPDKVTKHIPKDLQDFEASCALWRGDSGFRSTIRLSNQLLVNEINARVTLYMADGTPYELPGVRLAPGAVAAVDVNDALEKAPDTVRSHVSDYGSAAVRYQYDWQGVIYASMSVLNVPRSLEYTPPCTLRPVSANSAADKPQAQNLRGLWWRQFNSLDGFLAVANTTDKAVRASVRASGAASLVEISLPPHGTVMRRLPELTAQAINANARAGGIEVTYTGRFGDLQVAGGLEDLVKGYSIDLPLVRAKPSEGQPGVQRYGFAGVMVGAQQSVLDFPAHLRFVPFAYFLNLSPEARQLRFEAYYTQGVRTVGSLPLGSVTVVPGAAVEVPLAKFTSALANSEALNLAVAYEGYPGDILASVGSTDQSGTYVFPVRAEPLGPSGSRMSTYWRVGNGFDTMYTIWNPGETDQEVLATLRFSGGTAVYEVPVHLGAHESAMIDIGEIAREGKLDSQERLLPLSPMEGTLVVSGPQNGPEDMINVVVSGGIYNPRKATCGGTCQTCNGMTSPCFDPTGFLLPPGSSQQGGLCYNNWDGYVYWVTNSSNWTSNNPSIATVQTHGQSSPGRVTGANPGSTSIYAQYLYMVPVNAGQLCSPEPIPCPTQSLGNGGPVTVAQMSCTPTSVTRGSDVTCTVSGVTADKVTSWGFSGGGGTVTGPSGQLSWIGTMVAGGTISATVTGFGQLQASITVTARSWHTQPASASEVENGQLVVKGQQLTLPVPPTASGNDSGCGVWGWDAAWSAMSSTVIGSGPNKDFAYFASNLNFTTFFSQYTINPDLKNGSSVFSQKQWGACGFISQSNLLTQTRRHEYSHPTQSHHGEYTSALNGSNNNFGDYLESRVAPPGANLPQWAADTSAELTNRASRITSASSVEPYAVNENESGVLLGNINYAPYTPCP